MKFVYANKKYAITKCMLFKVLINYHSQITHNIKINIHEKKILTAKNWVKQMLKICTVIMKWWEAVAKA